MLNKFNALFITFLLLAGCLVTQKTFSEQDINLKKLSVEKFDASFHIPYNNKLYGYIYNVDLGTKTDLNTQSIKQSK